MSGGAPRGLAVDPARQYRGGGKPGRVCIKAPPELRELRALSRTPGLTGAQALRMAELEREHAAAVGKAKAAKAAPTPVAVDAADASRAGTGDEGPGPVPVDACERLHPAAPSCSDPERLARIRRAVADQKGYARRSAERGEPPRVWAGLVVDLWWLVMEIYHLGESRDPRRLVEVLGWAVDQKRRHRSEIEDGGFLKVLPEGLFARADWCLAEIEWLLARGTDGV